MRYALSNIFGDPFWLTTVPMALVGWVVALVGSILNNASNSNNFPIFSWWGIAFEMIAIMLTLHAAFSNEIRMYRLATLAFLAIATVYTTNSTNNFVWRDNFSSGTAAAGNILLSIINFVWILYFGTTQDEPTHTYIDSFAAYKKMSPQTEFQKRMREKRYKRMMGPSGNFGSAGQSRDPNQLGTASQPYRLSDIPQQVDIGRPTDLSRKADRSNPLGPYPEGTNSQPTSNPLSSTYLYSVDQLHRHGLNGHEVEQPLDIHGADANIQRYSVATTLRGRGLEDPYSGDQDDAYESMQPIAKARARFSYDARTSDGELPFKEGETLEICDMTGNWWYCKRENGEFGICPRNYLDLLDESLL